MNKATVIARLTANFADGRRLIVEVHADATVEKFYRHFWQTGNRRSTKKLFGTTSRFCGIYPHYRAVFDEPGLERVAERFHRQAKAVPTLFPMTEIKIRILRKRAYRKLLVAPCVSEQPVMVVSRPDPRLLPKPVLRYPVHIPSNHTTIAKKVSILTGRR